MRGGKEMLWLLAGALLAGCSSVSGVISSSSPDENSPTTSPTWTARVASFFSGAKPGVSQPASPIASTPEVECPGVDIRNGASTLNITAKADAATAADVRYQLSFGQTARECAVQGGTMTIKVGVQGRAIVGPLGAPGTVDVPLRYAVVREGPEPKTIVTKFKRTSVTIAQGERHAQFMDIEEALSFPLPPSTELEAYVVYVGFDEVGDPREKKPARTGKSRKS
ncbi:MAG: hypothetical protein ABWZ64_02795 [Xanthobacteraceae bacterium]